ncbi:JmjC-domain-containing protein [Hortaea werneckii]|nr:JmjC-domain-containing protein [Hortaea werneckii]KAI7318540.1 JmjC-domain-containing protein [Hortaea werneckii]
MEGAGTPADATTGETAALSPESQESQHAKPSTEPTGAKPANALTPPTSEEMNHEETMKDQEESELSDLDLEDEEDEIKPDHYWEGGKIPVFKPTMHQFRDFSKFIAKVDQYGMKSGIVKVIPPDEWRDSLPQLDEMVKRIKIKNPITQEFNGAYGTYTQQNVEKQRSYNLPEWKALTEETQHQPPAKRGERRRNQAQVVRGDRKTRGREPSGAVEREDSPKSKKKPGRQGRKSQAAEDEEADDEATGAGQKTRGAAKVPPTPDSPATKPAKGRGAAKGKGSRQPRGGQAKSVSSRRLNNTAESADYIDEEAFKDFNYRMEGLDEFTPERCAELENHYWKSLAFNQPMYAADMPGSLFAEDCTSWNVAHLPNLLDVLGTKVPGVNTAYLYMGMWKATFAWHLEDVDLYSINYIHFGAPKQWYSISQEDARKFEAAMRQVWPLDSKNCGQFLRHKTYLISPDVLQKQYGVKVNKLVHYEGEFVITYPYGYHSGYNIGYNCAESVNFATESWLEYGRIARKCNCESDNVWVDVGEIERKLRGEPTPEYYEETDDEDEISDEEEGALPSPPASVKGKPQKSKKRKREAKEEKPKKKKKIRIKIRAPTREPCVMCPNDNPWEPLLPTDNGKKAHKSCADFTPETFIVKDDQGNEQVCGIASIDRARLELKCNFCRSKRGACFQCSSKKCTRAFHATCALAAGVLIDGGLVPTFGEDGTEYIDDGYDFRCKYHRIKMPKNVNIESLENNKRINNFAKELKFNDVVQAQYVGGEVFAGLVVENRPSETSVVVDVLPDGERVEVEWKWLCVLDPVNSLRPRPSAHAKPLPEGMNKKNVSVNNRQDGVPQQDEQFHDNPEYKWCDFYNMHMPPPGFSSKAHQVSGKLNVKIDAPDQLYYYLPKVSTEAKCFFTDDSGSNQIATKANFLDRMAQSSKPSQPHTKYSAAQRQPVMAARPTPAHITHHQQQQHPPGFLGNSARFEKPYTYKPKEPARPNVMWGVDPKSLAGQRSFLAEAGRRPSQSSSFMLLQQQQQPPPPYPYHSSDFVHNPATPRPFSREHYYSSEKLPAAYPGEYSGFMQVARRQSNGAQGCEGANTQNGSYVPNYQSIRQQQAQIKQSAPTAPMVGAAMPPNPYTPSGSSRPTSSAHAHKSPAGAPLTPAASASSTLQTSEMPQGYLENLQKYPYLKNSFLRAQKQYESPYNIGGGFAASYQPIALNRRSEPAEEKKQAEHTPSASVSSTNEFSRRQSQQWTPPSAIWAHAQQMSPPAVAQQPAKSYQQAPQPPLQQAQPRKYPPPMHQSTHDFQQSWQQYMPSTASRDGAQARAMREQMGGYGPFAPHSFHSPQNQHPQPQHRNSFGHAYDTAQMFQSPKAPTLSPLSDQHTPGMAYNHNIAAPNLGPLNRPQATGPGAVQTPPMQPNGQANGPMPPQMHPTSGNETWRYN